ncbi:MAG: zinc metallopeptidase [Fibrobacter sp.]|uniref:zinc metallopeptidase n=1 Tax=Fibrobacter sp. TaxID=35828 RepID=UPI00388FCE6B|nr:zinc metallopeptidase [Fibrobacter sp.]
MMFDPLYMTILVVALALSGGVSMLVKTRFAAGQKVNISSGLTGAEVAMAILMDAGITDVKVLVHQGFLSDHYNPMNKTLNLSKDVYYGRNASAAGVAAHEVGHAIQHAQGYFPMWLRSLIVPAANVGSNLGPWLVIIGIVLMSSGRALGYSLAVVGVILFGLATLFTLVTVPVEFDASSRAKKALARMDVVAQGREYNTVSGVLFAAGLTYVAAAITSILQLLYWAYRAGLLGGRRD